MDQKKVANTNITNASALVCGLSTHNALYRKYSIIINKIIANI